MFGTNKLYPILSVVLLLLSMAGTVFLFQQSRDTRNRAATSGHLICMPIDDSGNITNDKYRSNRIKVINETDKDIYLKVQENACNLQNPLGSPYVCNTFINAYPKYVKANDSIIFSQASTCQKTIQLDVQKDNDRYVKEGMDVSQSPECWNSIDNRTWDGGLAFTLKSNPESCSASPTSTPYWIPATCTNGVFSGCMASTNPIQCSNYGGAGNSWNDCQKACATVPRDAFCAPIPTIIRTPNTPITPTSTPRPTSTGIPPTNTPIPTSTPPADTPIPTTVATNTVPTITDTPQLISTNAPVAIAPSPTTITTLPQTGLNFPIQGLTIVGLIVTLFGLLILL